LFSPVTPPDAKSASHVSSCWASNGAKKSVAFSEPSDWTVSLTTDSPRELGGVLPGVAVEGAPVLPVLTSSVPGPSEVIPAPDCQMPAPLPPGTPTQRALIAPAVETPNTQPCQVFRSQSDPNAAYTTPFISSRPGRC